MRMKYILGLSALAISGVCHAADWRFPHGDSANTGFSNTVTAAAGAATRVDQVGELAAGAGPVVSPDGNVYVGNLGGTVQAFSADGTYRWSRQLPAGQWVTSSPVIGADGSVYVVAETRFPVQGFTNSYRYESMLHKFSPSGDVLFQAPFPQRWANEVYSSRGDANATPNIWNSNGVEAIIVPAVYSLGNVGSYNSLRLIAFSTQGVVLGDSLVNEVGSMAVYGDVTGGNGCDWWNLLCWLGIGHFGSTEVPASCTDLSTCLPVDTGYTQLGVAIWDSVANPVIVVSDGLKNVVGFTLDPAHGFRATFSVTDARDIRTSTPMMLPNGYSVEGVTVLDSTGSTVLRFDSSSPTRLSSISGFGPITGSITRLPDGRLVAIERSGLLRLVDNNTITGTLILRGESVAAASASSNYLYVSSAGALTTFDVHSLAQVASFGWSGGGRSSAAIGPSGQVYAVAGTELYVWPPPQSTVVGSVQLHTMMSGTGSITSTPAGINCSYRSIRCFADFVVGSQVVLNAAGLTNPNTHDEFDFDHWEGDCAGSSFSCSIAMDQAKTAKAVFVKIGNSGE